MLNNPHFKIPKILEISQSGKIWPNLVTLLIVLPTEIIQKIFKTREMFIV